MDRINKVWKSLKLGITELRNSKWKILFLCIYIILVSFFIKKYIIFENTFIKDLPNTFYPIVKSIVDIFFEESNFTLESFYLVVKNIL